MTNLLLETLAVLKKHNKTEEEVIWVGTDKEMTIFENFKKQADLVYDEGFGNIEIDTSLVIVGKNWWLERAEYDGSEWWVFKASPVSSKRVYNSAIQLKKGD